MATALIGAGTSAPTLVSVFFSLEQEIPAISNNETNETNNPVVVLMVTTSFQVSIS
jgi:hypothetical protein